jgi:hypothetical protein
MPSKEQKNILQDACLYNVDVIVRQQASTYVLIIKMYSLELHVLRIGMVQRLIACVVRTQCVLYMAVPCFDQGGGRNLGCFLNLAYIDGLSPDQRDDMGTLEY